MLLKTLVIYFAWIYLVHGVEDKARYDNYRVYHVHFRTDEQVKLFQQIEERSDSYTFMGHAREVNQNLTFLVAPHKIADLTDILTSYNVGYKILVS